MSKLLGVVLNKGGKNYLLITQSQEEPGKWKIGSFSDKKHLLDQIDAQNISELLTNTIEWASMNPKAINLPVNPIDLKKYSTNGGEAIHIFTGDLSRNFMGGEVSDDILKLVIFDVFKELSARLRVDIEGLKTDITSTIKKLTKKVAPKKKTATKKAAPKKALTKKK